ncbi:hypothetical protein HAP41_0000009070 [Bradyrhizobium barranii subsp. apii]|uniref:Uncharacterized protein n=1 Tax=Bradyrhizobium barranii subsp. apii TaxID=2819348 RepID=A0A8T5VLI8_9BRAD|nr:hypothetical protein [Bradyrhizobium barranii]UPT89109.1 hypothetical protein HAP41_0000009070 [Bradyrhizobium barranii subsp. apii]UPT95127.1 hypothetical protein J4G48_0038820 [Bradyrhizobium barranii subsp. apii]
MVVPQVGIYDGRHSVARAPLYPLVMPGLVPGIHVFPRARQGVDGRVKPGHDGKW